MRLVSCRWVTYDLIEHSLLCVLVNVCTNENQRRTDTTSSEHKCVERNPSQNYKLPLANIDAWKETPRCCRMVTTRLQTTARHTTIWWGCDLSARVCEPCPQWAPFYACSQSRRSLVGKRKAVWQLTNATYCSTTNGLSYKTTSATWTFLH